MNRLKIKEILHSKIDEWLSTITDKNLKDILKKEVFIAGGAISSLYLSEKVNDYDIFVLSEKTVHDLIKYYLPKEDTLMIDTMIKGYQDHEINPFREYEVDKNKKYQLKFASPHALTLTDRIQIITKWYGNPIVITNNFDFIHTQCYYDYESNELASKANSLESILFKRIICNELKYPIASLVRIKKLLKKDWNISAGQLLKISFAINDLYLTDIDVLRDQIVGVDIVIFSSFLDKLKDKKEIDSSHISYLVDKLFEGFECD